MSWILLLRAVNVGGRNRLAMKELKVLLEALGATDVRTVLNSGNAVFTSSRTDRQALSGEIEAALADRWGLDVRACLRTTEEVQAALDALPSDLPSGAYVLVAVLFDEPTAEGLTEVLGHAWAAEHIRAGKGVLYLGYEDGVHSSKLTAGWLEKRLGVWTTSRTPATLGKLV